MDEYAAFIARKSAAAAATGFDVAPEDLHPAMFPHQRDVTRWALRRGRAAMFLDTGLGKSLCQLVWADHVNRSTSRPVIVLAPLAVAEQTVSEAKRWGIEGVTISRGGPPTSRIVVANYEMLHAFTAADFGAVVLDESSILKNYNGATRKAITEAFGRTPYRLCCTATPSPNDYTELGTHSEFLGIKPQKEMLAEFFVHDGANRATNAKELVANRAGLRSQGDWRLKGHAEDAFWKWVTTWAALVRRPSDLGYDDAGYALPPLRMHEHVIPATQEEAFARGMLFAPRAVTLQDQKRTRRGTLKPRAELAARIANETDGQVLVWCELNDEADAVTDAISGAVQVAGSDESETKSYRMLAFAAGKQRVLVSKPSICGFGMNFQTCATMVFVGASHSFEQTYQAIRRCWRFGQTLPVDVHVIRAETEDAIVENFRRKERDVENMGIEMSKRMRETIRAEVGSAGREWKAYDGATTIALPEWL